MSIKTNKINTRKLMELTIETMRNSISENRTDKASPLVGAVIVLPDGSVETAYRGELADGEHAEYTLIERKMGSYNLAGATLFCTLEPCGPGARGKEKTPCAKWIVKRRISKVWVGIEDPHPLVDGNGIQYLQEHGVSVEMFDRDLQEEIKRINEIFIKEAEELSRYEGDTNVINASELEKPFIDTSLEDLNKEEVEAFINKTEEFKFSFGSEEFIHIFTQLRYLAKVDNHIHPTGLGILLFGKYPQVFFPQAVIRATIRTSGRNEDIATFSGSLPKQAIECDKWFKNVIGKQGIRTSAERKVVYDYPADVIRECVNNALAHRSYDIHKASVHLEINDDTIIVRSPGGPVKPIGMERIQRLDAPYLSKNPKITFVFDKLNLSEGRGLGFETMRNLPILHNLPLPIATFDDPYLNFIFSRAYGKSNDGGDNIHGSLNKIEAKGYDFIRLNSPITRVMYEECFGVSGKTARRHLAHLIELNLIRRVGAGINTSYEII
ncbi:MAG: hypothetical protein LBD23_15010 [Oscillospiraceae bacterium]|jgi:ATP-dependent DNA helicase RecG|nr:hypothetical protein [Oscillospiraceae bacterium]